MYQNIYFNRKENQIYIWDDETGLKIISNERYAYKPYVGGEYKSIFGDSLKKVYKFNPNDESLFESDVPVETRTLIDLYEADDSVSKNHRIVIFDIEVSMKQGVPDITKAKNEITSIALYNMCDDEYFVYILDEDSKLEDFTKDNCKVYRFDDESDLLKCFIKKYKEISPTILSGWNIDYFDIPYLYNRLKRVHNENVANMLSPIDIVYYNPYKTRFVIAGVSCLDYLALYKNFNYTELANYRLDTIGKKELNLGKVEYEGTLDTLLETDINKFIDYNLIDVKIVVGLEEKLKFIELARSICHVGHVPYEDILWSSKYLEGALLTFLRRQRLVAPNKSKDGKSELEEKLATDEEGFAGAYVKEPVPGLYNWVFSCDINSLYPSIIRSLNISPETKTGKVLNWNSVKLNFD